MSKPIKSKKVRVTFSEKDVSELYFMIRNRGECETRRKLWNALRKLSPETANTLFTENACGEVRMVCQNTGKSTK